MPTYEYRCNKCGEHFDVFQSFAEESLKKHPGKCGGKVLRVLSPAGIVFSGSGFYKTDNRRSGVKSMNGESKSNGSDAKTSESNSGGSDSKSSESKSGASSPSESKRSGSDSKSGESSSRSSDSKSGSGETKKSA